MNASKIPGAKSAAMSKIQRWAKVQSAARAKKEAARKSGNEALAQEYMKAEFKASARRSRHENALCAIDKWEREAAEG